MAAAKKKGGKATGRPPRADRADVREALLQRVSKGELVTSVCVALGVHPATVRKWAADDAEFGALYARAREDQAHAMAEQVIALADDETLPAESRRVRVDARKWLTSKIAPRTYGEKVTTEVTGEGGGPVKVEHSIRWGTLEVPL